MRQQVTIYLPDELYERFKHESVRQGLSLSAYVTRQLATTPSQRSAKPKLGSYSRVNAASLV